MLLTPLFFFSCENTEEVTGKVEATIGGKQHTFPMATFTKQGDKTIIASTDVGMANSVSIAFKPTTIKTGTYTLGVGTDLLTALANIGSIGSAENIFLYYPTGDADQAFVSIFGVLNITEYSADKIVGTFSGTGVTKSIANGLNFDTITKYAQPFAGSFTAKSYGL